MLILILENKKHLSDRVTKVFSTQSPLKKLIQIANLKSFSDGINTFLRITEQHLRVVFEE